MSTRSAEISRTTKETDIRLRLELTSGADIELSTGLPFFEHMLRAMAFHGGFGLAVKASGDVAVDPHHLVEDCGLVLGDAFARILRETGPVHRYGSSVIPMDDALSEAVVDVCNRPYLVYRVNYPQEHSGDFPMALLREFFLGLANRAQINLHLRCRYGKNSHHMAESLFKAAGRALAEAYSPAAPGASEMSTKGML